MNTLIEAGAVQQPPALTIKITSSSGGKYKSIEDLEWENVPAFAVVTGLNGSGKTQLLEILAYKLTGTTPWGMNIEGLQLDITGDLFPPESVVYLPSRWEFTPQASVGIPQMQESRNSLWNEVVHHTNNDYDIRVVTKRARIRKLVGDSMSNQELFKTKLSEDYAYMLEDGDVVAGLAYVLVVKTRLVINTFNE